MTSGIPPQPDASLNLMGVPCPFNFVRTKLQLEVMKSGEILEIILDKGEPTRSVPRSVIAEGHIIIHSEDLGKQIKLLIRCEHSSHRKPT